MADSKNRSDNSQPQVTDRDTGEKVNLEQNTPKVSAKDGVVNVTSSDTQTTLDNTVVADRVSDRMATPEEVNEFRESGKYDTNVGEELARKQEEEFGERGGEVRLVETEINPDEERHGAVSAVRTPVERAQDNGKVYKDIRIDPRDTNAPDAGLTPDGRRIAE